ncbi:MAG: prolyl aminopeptidase [Steroidobacteraceae bacterium]
MNRSRDLFPPIEPYRTGYLALDQRHRMYWEEAGNPQGPAILFLHGGPGAGATPAHRRFFDPAFWRIVIYDQRGGGRSTPLGAVEENTPDHLLADIERLRQELGIAGWVVFGGSWGSTLALAYAESHPDRVTELVLRGIFMLRRWELEWFYQNPAGAGALYPDLWEDYVTPIPQAERGDMMRAYYTRLTSEDAGIRTSAAKTWSVWEAATSHLLTAADYVAKFEQDRYAEAFARIECHYFINGGFLRSDNQLIDDVDRIRHIPAVIVQGRYDIVCPMKTAWELHRAWPEADLRIVPDAGHSAFERGNLHELIMATDGFAGLRQ